MVIQWRDQLASYGSFAVVITAYLEAQYFDIASYTYVHINFISGLYNNN